MSTWLDAPLRALHRITAPALALALAATLLACGGGGNLPNPLSVNDRRALPADFTARAAVNYSPYRTSLTEADTATEVITPANVKQDLELVRAAGIGTIRLFSSRAFGETVLQVIRDNGLDLQVQLGAYPNQVYDAAAEADNQAELDECIRLANKFSDIVKAVSVGNETMVYWSSHPIAPETMAGYLRKVREAIIQPVTTDDNYAFWAAAPKVITDVVDFASVHTYTLLDTFYDPGLWDWRQKAVPEAQRAAAMMDAAVAEANRQFGTARDFLDRIGLAGMPMVIGETGWFAVDLPGDPAVPFRAGRVNQKMYFDRLQAWAAAGRAGRGPVSIYYFEAFDEAWKGADDGWGLFNKDRQARYVLYGGGACPSGFTAGCEPLPADDSVAQMWVPPDYSEPPVAGPTFVAFDDGIAAGLRTDPYGASVGTIANDATAPEGTKSLMIAPNPLNYGWGFFFSADPATDTSPTPTENLSDYAATGSLKFWIKTNGYPGALQIRVSSDTDDRDVVEAIVQLRNGDAYGYCNTNSWCQVSIPIRDFTTANPKLDLRLVVSRFTISDIFDQTGKPLNTTGLPNVYIDDIRWSK